MLGEALFVCNSMAVFPRNIERYSRNHTIKLLAKRHALNSNINRMNAFKNIPSEMYYTGSFFFSIYTVKVKLNTAITPIKSFSLETYKSL